MKTKSIAITLAAVCAPCYAALDAAFSSSCSYTCADGTVPRTSVPGYTPQPNGCGTTQFPMQVEGERWGFTDCCNTHDICYGTCGTDYHVCESAFATCLNDICEANYPDASSPEGSACRSTAQLFQTATKLAGCVYYTASQEHACDCAAKGGPARAKLARRQRELTDRGAHHGMDASSHHAAPHVDVEVVLQDALQFSEQILSEADE